MVGDHKWAGGTVFTDAPSITIDATLAQISRAVCRIGDGYDWYAGDILWPIRTSHAAARGPWS